MTKAYDDRETWAIVIGRLRNWNRNPKTWKVEPMLYGAPKPEGIFELTMMLVEKHKFDLYHRVGIEREIDERITANWNWKYREFKVGGPGRGERVRFGAFAQGPEYLVSKAVGQKRDAEIPEVSLGLRAVHELSRMGSDPVGTLWTLARRRSTDVWLEFIETAVFAEGASDCGCGLDEGERESDKGTDVEVDAFKYGFDFTNLSEVEAGHSAACEMSLLCFRFWVHIGGFQVDEPEIWEQRDKFPFRIITAEVAELLHIPLDFGTRQSLSALWALAYTRSSSRPVDTVFSLMDLLGINLDVEQFLPEERTKATIKLIQEVMKLQGGRALWLYIAPWVKPSWEISTLPEMPETSESGRAYFSTSTGKVLAIDAICAEERWRAGGLPNPTPKGEMTDSGYFVFSAKAALNTGKMAGRLASMTKAYDDRETWAIVIGRLRNWNRNPKTWKVEPMLYGAPKPEGIFELTMMLVEKHKFDLYHRVGIEREIDERITANWNWKYREFKVGGPGRGERVRFGAFAQGPEYL
ncbi:hypothetical protein ARMSODRAFT_1026199 [Armillaria solidipes]|uniref:Heterokaryon incompatibility domain-containing protein n=1 Tax=Armillaria solidipes TaxID=1076256 RepID=A0A2H3APM5_9AGAR|nr:hypothetical protein ARMSODRAFT_1026199 [Armillaria solidipes]